MILNLMRHGENTWTQLDEIIKTGILQDHGLSAEGIQQIELALEREKILEATNISLIYASPAQRAVESAQIITKKSHLNFQQNKLIKDVQLPTGINLKNAIRKYQRGKKWWELWLQGFPGFEKPEVYLERIARFIDFLKSRHNDSQVILCIAHEETFWGIMTLTTEEYQYNPKEALKQIIESNEISYTAIKEFRI